MIDDSRRIYIHIYIYIYIHVGYYYIGLINSPHEVGKLGMVQMASGLNIYHQPNIYIYVR